MSGGSDEGAEKSHEPTQKRLDEARKRGEVAQSHDLVTAASYGGLLLAAMGLGGWSLARLAEGLAGLLAEAAPLSEAAFADGGAPLWGGILGRAASAALPWVALPAAAALLAVLAQGSLVVAPERIAPKLSRLDPIAQVRQKLGRDGIVEFLKGVGKLAAHGTVMGLYLRDRLPEVVGAAAAAPGTVAVALGELTVGLLVRVAVVAAVLGALDLLWQRLSYLLRHRMSRQEVTDEMKEHEGDPHVKGQRRARAVAIATNRMLADVAGADVVVVNPTHYAVALRWDKRSGRAPTCVAKGVDDIARAIRERAAEAGVPVRRDPPTARALYATVEIGQEVHRRDWRAVAAAIRFAEAMRAKAKARAPR